MHGVGVIVQQTILDKTIQADRRCYIDSNCDGAVRVHTGI